MCQSSRNLHFAMLCSCETSNPRAKNDPKSCQQKFKTLLSVTSCCPLLQSIFISPHWKIFKLNASPRSVIRAKLAAVRTDRWIICIAKKWSTFSLILKAYCGWGFIMIVTLLPRLLPSPWAFNDQAESRGDPASAHFRVSIRTDFPEPTVQSDLAILPTDASSRYDQSP